MYARTSIDEANKHLQALHKRVQELEKTVKDQHEALVTKDAHMREKLHAEGCERALEVNELTVRLLATNEKVIMLENIVKEKDQQIHKLQDRSRVLDRILGHRPALESLLTTMIRSGGSNSDSGFSTSDSPLDNQSPNTAIPGGSHGSVIRRMAKNFNSHSGRRKQFSISEDDDEDQNADTEGETSTEEKSQEKELYL